jgi:serine/threonine-protein kinase
MASVHLARMTASTGFTRLVAIKRLHREYTFDRNFIALFSQEARLCAQIRHTNVIGTLDLLPIDGTLSLVLEYVEGESLAALMKRARALGEPIPLPFAATIMHGVLCGLDAAHEAQRDDGAPLGIVHRDVSPHNILVGIDGNAKIIDFGVAKARDGLQLTQPGELRGKLAYMPREQLLGGAVTRQFDIYAAGVVLWELLAGERLYPATEVAAVSAAVLEGASEPPSAFNPEVPPELDDVVMRALAQEPTERYATAGEFATALEPWRTANERAIGAWVSHLAAERLASMRSLLQRATEQSGRIESLASYNLVEQPSGSQQSGGVFERTLTKSYQLAPAPMKLPVRPAILAACGSAIVLGTMLGVLMSRDREASFDSTVPPPAAADPAPAEMATATATAQPSIPEQPVVAPSAPVEPDPNTAIPVAVASSVLDRRSSPRTQTAVPTARPFRHPAAVRPTAPSPAETSPPKPAETSNPANTARDSRDYR